MPNTEQLRICKSSVAQWNSWRSAHPDVRPDLAGADLSGANLSGMDLHGVSLAGANLACADLSEANLTRTALHKLDAPGGCFEQARMTEARLTECDLSNGVFRFADLRNAEINGCNLREADLRCADLRECFFTRTDLYRADFTAANLERGDLARLSGVSDENPSVSESFRVHLYKAEFARANLKDADLHGADLTESSFRRAILCGANLSEAILEGSDLSGADLSRANLAGADLRNVTMRRCQAAQADFSAANMQSVDLRRAMLDSAKLSSANLRHSDLRQANLQNADLTLATLVSVDLRAADLRGCRVYGTSVWDVRLEDAKQSDLVVNRDGQPLLQVDNLLVAQFLYLLIDNKRIRDLIDTITSRVVLILGRFTPERKPALDGLRVSLRKHGYVPVLFDFARPTNRNITETVSTIAHLSRFVIADITEAKSIPQELQRIVPDLPSVPVQPILLESERPYGMFSDFEAYSSVLPLLEYGSAAGLSAVLAKRVIRHAEAMATKLAGGRHQPFQRRGRTRGGE